MKIEIKRIDNTLPLPKYETSGSVAFDLYSRIDMTIKPFTPTIMPTNFIIKTPPGYFLMLASRSSTPLKKGLMVANGIGVVDEDYCGDSDEIGLQLLNFTQKDIEIKKGDRIGQALFVKIEKADEFDEKETMDSKSRGGFGSTG
jgi:dUTP pyrophosphatase